MKNLNLPLGLIAVLLVCFQLSDAAAAEQGKNQSLFEQALSSSGTTSNPDAPTLDPVEKVFLTEIEKSRNELGLLNTNDIKYKHVQRRINQDEAYLADHRYNRGLWRELDIAKTEGNEEAIQAIEAKLSAFVSRRLTAVTGVSNPPGQSLQKSIDDVNRQLGNPVPWRGKKTVLTIVFLTLLTVPFLIILLKRKYGLDKGSVP